MVRIKDFTRGGRPLAIAFTVLALLATGLVATLPHAGAETEVHLTAAGDYGARAATATVLNEIANRDPDAHLALGDLAYGDAVPESAWCSYVKTRVGEGFPFELISGNHESLDVADGLINNYSACLPNQIPGVVGTYGREYYMDFPQVSPIVRVIQASPTLMFEDGRWNYNVGDAHYNWLSNAIDDGRAKGAQWIIVTGHIPCQSVGVNNCPSTDFYRLMTSKKVDLVLSGHEHAYMRTHQLRSGVTGCTTIPTGSFNASCVADSDSSFIAGQGSVFATVGTGGTPLRDVNPADSEAGYFAAYSGLNANATYGLLDLSITASRINASFVGTSGGTFTDSFTITKGTPPANQPPVAAISTQVQDRTVTVNGSGSSDPDGSVTGYAWDFGDGSGGSGVGPLVHTYAAAGPYTVTLIVTDDSGATDATSTVVTATDPPPPTSFASDTFSRTVANGLGTADVGGAWTLTGAATSFSVANGVGRIAGVVASKRAGYLTAVQQTNVDITTDVALSTNGSGGGAYLTVSGRRVSNGNEYGVKLRYMPGGSVTAYLNRTVGGAETTLTTTNVPNLTLTPGDVLRVRFQVNGSPSTTVRSKVWRVGSAEPAAWLQTNTAATPTQLQGPGGVGFLLYLSGSWTGATPTLSVDNLNAGPIAP